MTVSSDHTVDDSDEDGPSGPEDMEAERHETHHQDKGYGKNGALNRLSSDHAALDENIWKAEDNDQHRS